ncbi:MAG: acyl-CoA dehydrogenase family protein [Myxococcota bacterium]|nr:acyl-CoA dehydrogenase family protein [Myxococcota bacterium]
MSNLETFRAETRAWVEANAPASLLGTRQGKFDGYWGGRKNTETNPDVITWFERMLEKGWTAPMWPTEYGGGGLSRDEAGILNQELARLKLPPPLVGFGLAMIGPTLLEFGTEAQKAEHLPKIIKGEIRWCQGYSEPGSGSDLASLQTKAVPDGDDLVINGQKVWTSHADRSDWIFCLTRTSNEGKKQEGITFVLFDLESRGVSVRKIELISGASPFCEVFFDDVRAKVSNIIGEVGKGWTVAKALLNYERSMIGEAIGGQMKGTGDVLVEAARDYLDSPEGPLPDAGLRQDLASFGMDEACFMYTIKRIRAAAAAGSNPGPVSSILKVCGSELKQRRWELQMQVAGPHALGWEGPGFDEGELDATRQWLRSKANSIEGGTSEIQLNIIAQRVLGLPK